VSLSLSLFISHSLIDGLHYSCILHLLEDLFESRILVARNIFDAFECVYCSLCTRVVLFYLFVVIVFLIVFASNFPRRRHKKVQFFHGKSTIFPRVVYSQPAKQLGRGFQFSNFVRLRLLRPRAGSAGIQRRRSPPCTWLRLCSLIFFVCGVTSACRVRQVLQPARRLQCDSPYCCK